MFWPIGSLCSTAKNIKTILQEQVGVLNSLNVEGSLMISIQLEPVIQRVSSLPPTPRVINVSLATTSIKYCLDFDVIGTGAIQAMD